MPLRQTSPGGHAGGHPSLPELVELLLVVEELLVVELELETMVVDPPEPPPEPFVPVPEPPGRIAASEQADTKAAKTTAPLTLAQASFTRAPSPRMSSRSTLRISTYGRPC